MAPQEPHPDPLLTVIHQSLLRELSTMRSEITDRLDDISSELKAHLKDDDVRFSRVFRYIYLAMGSGAFLMWGVERGLEKLIK